MKTMYLHFWQFSVFIRNCLCRAAFKTWQIWVMNKDPSIHAGEQAWKTVDSYPRHLIAQLEVEFFLFFSFLNIVYVCVFFRRHEDICDRFSSKRVLKCVYPDVQGSLDALLKEQVT